MDEVKILDEYETVINNEDTYRIIAMQLLNIPVIFAWTDELGTQYDILMVNKPSCIAENSHLIQRGVRPTEDLFVSIMSIGAFSFKVHTDIISVGGYVAEKLNIPHGPTADKLADLINGVRNNLKKY